MALLAGGVSELFIDGKMSAGSAGTFATVNPATEEVLGVAANADAADMDRAIDTRGEPSMRRTGRATPNCGCAACGNCARR